MRLVVYLVRCCRQVRVSTGQLKVEGRKWSVRRRRQDGRAYNSDFRDTVSGHVGVVCAG